MNKPTDHRQRLMESLAELVGQQGYHATTIADIVKHAKVSRRTFYEHFADKQACLLYCYQVSSQNTLAQIFEAMQALQHDSHHTWQQQLQTGIGVFLQCMQAQPIYMRVLYMEIVAAGVDGLRVRRQVLQQFAQIFSQVLQVLAPAETDELHNTLSMALVGAIHELLLQAFENNQIDQIMQLSEVLEKLVIGVLSSLIPRLDVMVQTSIHASSA